jgi:hypothetical protein
MHIYRFDGKYAVGSTFYFTLSLPAVSASGTSSDRLATAVPATLFPTMGTPGGTDAGCIKYSLDGASFKNVTNRPTQVVAGAPLYALTLTTAEMTATQINVAFVDLNGANPLFRDALMFIRTKMQLGQVDVDATQIGGNVDAMKLTGVGTGFGLNAIGGSTASAL